jgi:hypothetical protein
LDRLNRVLGSGFYVPRRGRTSDGLTGLRGVAYARAVEAREARLRPEAPKIQCY